jgi:hypothetical protein
LTLSQSIVAQLQLSIPAPFLFIGSGFSRRYLDIETWKSLLQRFAGEANKDFNYYFSKANGHLPTAGRFLAEDFHEVWWHSPKFESSRKQFGSHASSQASPLKFEISKYLNTKKTKTDGNLNSEIEKFKNATIDGIITTNWDTALENIFPDYAIFKGQDELLFSNPLTVAEIYKIHGCCTEPNSLVLTDGDYNQFNQRNAYLAAKLLTIFVEHPVIFLGYSLSDENVSSILGSIVACLKEENLKKLTDRLIFMQFARPNERVSEELQQSFLAINGKQVPLMLAKINSYMPIVEALATTKRRFPASLFRRVKNHIYELVQSSDPHEQMHVLNLSDDIEPSAVEVVYGVGIVPKLGSIGYDPIKTDSVMRDVVFDQNNYDPHLLLSKTLPTLLGLSRYVPVFRYLKMGGYLKDRVKLATLPSRVQAAASATRNNFLPPQGYIKKRVEVLSYNCSLVGLSKYYDLEHLALYLPYLEPPLLTVTQLEVFLRENYDKLYAKGGTAQNSLKKLVCLYDLMKFGTTAP